jgi:hypothetical protein
VTKRMRMRMPLDSADDAEPQQDCVSAKRTGSLILIKSRAEKIVVIEMRAANIQ